MFGRNQSKSMEPKQYYIVITKVSISENEAIEVVDEYLRNEYGVELTEEGRNEMQYPLMLMKLGSPYQIELELTALTEKEFIEALYWFGKRGILIDKGYH